MGFILLFLRELVLRLLSSNRRNTISIYRYGHIESPPPPSYSRNISPRSNRADGGRKLRSFFVFLFRYIFSNVAAVFFRIYIREFVNEI